MSRPLGRRRVVARAIAPAVINQGDKLEPQKVERAIDQVARAVESLRTDSVDVTVDLVTGDNVVAHGLGRSPRRVRVTPRTADAAFGWGWDARQQSNPRPDVVTVVSVVGGPMTAIVTME